MARPERGADGTGLADSVLEPALLLARNRLNLNQVLVDVMHVDRWVARIPFLLSLHITRVMPLRYLMHRVGPNREGWALLDFVVFLAQSDVYEAQPLAVSLVVLVKGLQKREATDH